MSGAETADRMELTAYLQRGWAPLIRPAPSTRPWMDATPEAFAYRCLPLNIANAHGWEVLNPCGFEAIWDGGSNPDAVTIIADPGSVPHQRPVALFGSGVVTFHVEAIFRTPPGWNLWVGGSPNRQKDGVAPLTGIVETDWSPFTFTMNWRFTRPGHRIRFEADEPFCFLFPVQRGAVEAFAPGFASIEDDPETERRFKAWSEARNAFHDQMKSVTIRQKSEGWQKNYYRGVDMEGQSLVEDHQSKLRLRPFDTRRAPEVPTARRDDPPATAAAAGLSAEADEINTLKRALAQREWLLEALERQRDLAPALAGIENRAEVDPQDFLERYYVPGRPLILEGELADWPALGRWSAEDLKTRLGDALVDHRSLAGIPARWDVDEAALLGQTPFAALIDALQAAGDGALLPRRTSARNVQALAALADDMRPLDRFLAPADGRAGAMWLAAAGGFMPLHHAPNNSLIAQVTGRTQFKILPAAEVGRLDGAAGVFNGVRDLDDPTLDGARYPRLVGARAYDLTLEAGQVLFLPFGWWRQARAADFSVTLTFANFRWRNDVGDALQAV
jgi:hypothetical protein